MFGVAAASFSILLIATGVTKLRRPHDTARALRTLGLPAPLALTYLVAVGEVMMGTLALVIPETIPLAAQALTYLVFLVWVLFALARAVPLATCGCLGRDDTPPYWGHVILNSLAVIVSGLAALFGDNLILDGAPPLAIVATVAFAVLGAFLGWHVIGVAATATSRRPV